MLRAGRGLHVAMAASGRSERTVFAWLAHAGRKGDDPALEAYRRFRAEYVAIVLMCALTTLLFLGGWLPPVDVVPFTWVPGVIWFILKVTLVFFMFAMVKAFVPRYRFDQLMRLGWKVFLPISLFMVVAVAAVLKITGWGI